MKRINLEAFVIAYLNGCGFSAFADVPDGKLIAKPAQFLTVEQTGGQTDGVAIGSAAIAVQSWAPSRYEASELAKAADVAMFKIVDNVNPVTSVNRTGFYNYPTSKMEPRYQGTYELTAHLYNFKEE